MKTFFLERLLVLIVCCLEVVHELLGVVLVLAADGAQEALRHISRHLANYLLK
jgi:hypothetical protein